MSRKEDSAYIFDQKLVPRIKQFLKGKTADTYIDPDNVARYLQNKFRGDYGRKKRTVFLHSVSKALEKARIEVFGEEAMMTPNKRRREGSSSDSEPENLVNYQDTNAMNLAMRNLYKNAQANASRDVPPRSPQHDSQPPNHQQSTIKKKKKKQQCVSLPDNCDKPKLVHTVPPQKTNATPVVCNKHPSAVHQPPRAWTIDRAGANGTDSGLECDSVNNRPVPHKTDLFSGSVGSKTVPPSGGGLLTATPQPDSEMDRGDDNTAEQTSANGAVVNNYYYNTYSCSCSSSQSHNHKHDGGSTPRKAKLSSSLRVLDEESVGISSETESVSKPGLGGNSVRKKAAVKDASQDSGGPVTKEKGKKRKTKDLQSDTKLEDLSVSNPSKTFKDFGGNEELIEELRKLLRRFSNPDVVRKFLSKTQTVSLLLCGPSGSGKHLLAECMAGEIGIPLVELDHISSLVSGVSGDSEQRIRDLFDQVTTHAPCILFLDGIENLAPNQNLQASSDMVNRMTSQLCNSLRKLRQDQEQVVVVAATNKISALDERLRYCFTEKMLGMPDERAREAILRKLCADIWAIPADFDFKTAAKLTPAFVAGDLSSLVDEAVLSRYDRFHKFQQKGECDMTTEDTHTYRLPSHLTGPNIEISPEETELSSVTMEDFKEALAHVQPAAKREGFATIPTTTWADVGAVGHVRERVESDILPWINEREDMERLGLKPNSGIILYGPPGCGKTMVAKAMANEAGLNFIDVKGPELLNKYVGESEKGLRQVFERAQMCAPCLIFFDEIDVMCSNRQEGGGSTVNRQVTTQFLTLMDGCGERKRVFVMGATNMIESLDPALLRPGRFNTKIFIGLPTVEGRLDILKALTKNGTKPPLESVDLQTIAEKTESFSGADLENLVDSAGKMARTLNTHGAAGLCVTEDHFQKALLAVKPSVSSKDLKKYSWGDQLFN